jgi:hypothetical protein
MYLSTFQTPLVAEMSVLCHAMTLPQRRLRPQNAQRPHKQELHVLYGPLDHLDATLSILHDRNDRKNGIRHTVRSDG